MSRVEVLALLLGGTLLVAACGRPSSPAASAAVPNPDRAAASSGRADRDSAEMGDADLPPLPVTPFPAARPMDIVRAVYVFAAKHPEVLSHVPCFCGCETRGHRHNDDCFVSARDEHGRPTAWEPHGAG